MDIRDWASKNILIIGLVSLALLLAFIELSPTLGSGYSGDDGFESLVKGYIMEGHTSLPAFVYNAALGAAEHLGRSFVLQFYYYPIFYYAGLHTYKLIIVLFVILDILSFGYFVRLLSRSDSLAVLGMVIMPLFFQFRLFHDPILAYHLQQQILLLLSLWSWIFLYYFLERGHKRDLALSLALYGISMGVYEATYPFFIISAAMVFYYWRDRSLSKRLGLSALFAALSAAFICLSVAVRLYTGLPLFGGNIDYAYSINTNVFAYLTTLCKLLAAALPLSYFVFDPSAIFSKSPLAILGGVSLTAGIIFLGTLTLFFLASKCYTGEAIVKDKRGSIFFMFILGALLFVLPEAMVSASYRYQQYIVPGLAYLPVYMSYFGAGLMALCLISAAYDRVNKKYATALIVIAGILAAGVGTLNYMDNRTVVDFSNQFWLYPRSVIEDGLHNGLMGYVPDGSTLITGTNYPWDQSAFYRLGSGKELGYVASKSDLIYMGFGKLDLARLPPGSRVDGSPGLYNLTGDDVYYLAYDSYAEREGYAVLGHVDHLYAPDGTVNNVTGQDFYVYARTAHGVLPNVQQQIARRLTICGAYASATGADTGYFEAGGDVVAAGDGWKLIHVVAEGGEVDLDSVCVRISA